MPDVFEDVFAPVPWQTSPRSARSAQSSGWRGASQRSTPRVVSRKPETGQRDQARVSRKAPVSRKQSSSRQVKQAAYDNVVVDGNDASYVLDPVPDDQIQGPASNRMEMLEEGMSYEPMDRAYGGMAYGGHRGDPAMDHPWQGGEYWFNPRYGLPPFMCRFPHWMQFTRGRLYFRGEYLVWWTAGQSTPPLVTTSPVGTLRADAGVLGEATTSILYGGERRNMGSQTGGRYSLGYWLSDGQCFGWELNYLNIGKTHDRFSAETSTTPIIARPFTNAVGGSQDAAIISFPDVAEGSVEVESTTEFWSTELLLRRAVVQSCDRRIDVVFGYRHGRLNGLLTVNDRVEVTGSQEPLPRGTVFDRQDRFETINHFNGAEFGVILNKRSGRWGLEMLAKLAIGRTSSKVDINGSTTITGAPSAGTYDGGILALPTNIGAYETKAVAVMPEIGFNLMYCLTPRASFIFGYTFIYMSHVARPGDQIDMLVNSSQFPPGTLSGVGLPEFQFRTTDFWAHGMNFGFDFRF